MLTYLVAFVLSALTAWLLTGGVRRFAIARGLYDAPDAARKTHDRPIPRIGGIAIATAFFVPVAALVFLDNKISSQFLADRWHVIGLFAGSAMVVVLGLLDDLYDLRPTTKLAGQVVIATFAWSCGYRIGLIADPFGGDPFALGLLAYPVTLLWLVGIMNAINLIDGLDGLAAGVTLFAVLALFAIAVVNGNPIVGLTSIALAGALIGFLRHNFNPASIFMGDSGSLFLGYVLATTAISGSAKSQTVVALTMPIVAFGIPLMDTLLTVLRRFVRGRSIFAADRGHMHHRLLDLGLNQRQAVLVLYGLCILLAAGGISLQYAKGYQAAAILAVFGLVIVVVSRMLGYLSLSRMSQSVRYGLRRQQALGTHLEVLHEAGRAIREAVSVDEAVDRLGEAAMAVGADEFVVRLAVTRPWDGGLDRWEHAVPEHALHQPTPAGPRHIVRLEHPLNWSLEGIELVGSVSFTWDCAEDDLRIPEVSVYDWLAMVLRDRVLELQLRKRALPLRPTAAEAE